MENSHGSKCLLYFIILSSLRIGSEKLPQFIHFLEFNKDYTVKEDYYEHLCKTNVQTNGKYIVSGKSNTKFPDSTL